MSTFKITNITHLLGKREGKFNSVLEVEYVDNLMKKNVKIKPNDTIYLSLQSLPISLHALRVKGLILISEVTDGELATVMANIAAPKVDIPVVIATIKPEPEAERVEQIKKVQPKKEKEVA